MTEDGTLQDFCFVNSNDTYEIYNQLLQHNEFLRNQVSNLLSERARLEEWIKHRREPPRRTRRLANQIARGHQWAFCSRQYGTESSLKLHQRIKHGGVPNPN